MSGLLVDPAAPDDTLEAFIGWTRKQRWFGIEFLRRSADSALAGHLAALVERRGMRAFVSEAYTRATLPIRGGREAIPPVRRRAWRLIHRRGTVDFRLLWPDSANAECVQTFIRLENMGWKSTAGSALAARPSHSRFFGDLMARHGRRRKVFFTELAFDDKVIGSTCNLVCGDVAFAFKIGWDPAYARYSPGFIQDIELLLAAPRELGELSFIDGCAVSDSYLNELWPGRRAIVSDVLALNGLGTLAGGTVQAARAMRGSFRRWVTRRASLARSCEDAR